MKATFESAASAHSLPFRRGARLLALLLMALALVAPAVATALSGSDPLARGAIDGERMLQDLKILAHDSMEGRQAGTAGGERARRFLAESFAERGLRPVGGERTLSFTFSHPATGQTTEGVNIIGMVPGGEHPGRYVIVTAHYDHLGVRDGEIYNGADDNASGTAALLALAAHFLESPPRHSLLFAALDAEEIGLLGARAFVSNPPVPLDSVLMNVNLDMVSRSDSDELYAAGTHHYPFLTSLVEEAADASAIHLLTGHDSPDLPPGDDWTMASDHGAFHEVGIPFIYFGVEDHLGYHHPSDTFENITPEFYLGAVNTVLDFLRIVDREGEGILGRRHRVGAELNDGTFEPAEGAFLESSPSSPRGPASIGK